MSEVYKRRLKNSLIILMFFICIFAMIFYFHITKNNTKDIKDVLVSVSNQSISNLSLAEFCSLLEYELNDKKIGDVKDKWKCFPVYEYKRNYKDIVFNKTQGLCNCTNILSDGTPINIQIRKAKRK